MDVWVLAGQSNTVGDNPNDGDVIPEVAKSWPGKILAFTPNDKWEDAIPNVHVGVHGFPHENSVGPDMAFARILISLGISQQVGFIPTAKCGSNLYQEWMPGTEFYSYMIARVHAAMAAAPEAVLRGMIWVQGESDALPEEPAPGKTRKAGKLVALQYGSNFTEFLGSARADLSKYHAELPCIMAVMSTKQREAKMPYIDIVRQQQMELDIPGVFKVDMQGFEFYPQQPGGDLIHLSKSGVSALGTAMAYCYSASTWKQAVSKS
mmetsp:Transcript_6239/g.13664  ORF Transcript_6239/g.13664 Transcript_6239/m.13664 type:complete len:264 (-) Transcript_6239:416-1207(-)|eukprot:CAMPEP_0202911338 /NCGR_PEP_ID=MMETSP1392-20130828/54694_1 /ASSEMBLY_ACC=CAM_ASM_000868 /TAXON_ID=225041 /ORGANISM="Chlamydomonas chlamydogama, Strain SAG 11-48b" /LENGTH=263 /DNA_ID=CAMNT_0049601805 /DNA_START=138 /DNA_END=929 /DNA_ORIENTATION=+